MSRLIINTDDKWKGHFGTFGAPTAEDNKKHPHVILDKISSISFTYFQIKFKAYNLSSSVADLSNNCLETGWPCSGNRKVY